MEKKRCLICVQTNITDHKQVEFATQRIKEAYNKHPWVQKNVGHDIVICGAYAIQEFNQDKDSPREYGYLKLDQRITYRSFDDFGLNYICRTNLNKFVQWCFSKHFRSYNLYRVDLYLTEL